MMLMVMTMWTDAGHGVGFETGRFMMVLAVRMAKKHPKRLVALYNGPLAEILKGF